MWLSSPDAFPPHHARTKAIVHHRFAARVGATILVPAFDSAWLSQSASVRPIAMLVGLAAVAILALLTASTAHRRGQRQRSRRNDEQLFTTTPLPGSGEARLRREPSPHHAFSGLKLPRWLQVGSLLVAMGITWMVSERLRPASERSNLGHGTARQGDVIAAGSDREPGDGQPPSPEDVDLPAEAAAPFRFRVQEWVPRGSGCAGRLEVTRGAPSSWSLTARVHDDQGRLLDSARMQVASLQPGNVVEFRFTRAACERIGAWDVRGTQREQ